MRPGRYRRSRRRSSPAANGSPCSKSVQYSVIVGPVIDLVVGVGEVVGQREHRTVGEPDCGLERDHATGRQRQRREVAVLTDRQRIDRAGHRIAARRSPRSAPGWFRARHRRTARTGRRPTPRCRSRARSRRAGPARRPRRTRCAGRDGRTRRGSRTRVACRSTRSPSSSSAASVASKLDGMSTERRSAPR